MIRLLLCLLVQACLGFPLLPMSGVALAQTAPGSLLVLPEGGRSFFIDAFARAQREIRIEICVLEDPTLLESLRAALQRGVRVRAIVDQGKYEASTHMDANSEAKNLNTYFLSAGGELHLSNPIFPRSFPKVILIDNREVLLGSACLDSMTFEVYRDFATRIRSGAVLKSLSRLFENDWDYSAPPGIQSPPFNPTPPINQKRLFVSPVNASAQMVSLYQRARKSLDVYSELLGNPTLESELAAAVARGVKVRMIAPIYVNNAPDQSIQTLQKNSLDQLKAAGVDIHVNGTNQSIGSPYLHARAAIVDGREAYLGSISLSPDSITLNREVGLLLSDPSARNQLAKQFKMDFHQATRPY